MQEMLTQTIIMANSNPTFLPLLCLNPKSEYTYLGPFIRAGCIDGEQLPLPLHRVIFGTFDRGLGFKGLGFRCLGV